jgi:hypothetical protein
VISTHFIKPPSESDDSDHNVDLSNMKKFFEVEIYNPHNWECINSIKLQFEPEEQKINEENKKEEDEEYVKIHEDTDRIKDIFNPDTLHRLQCATNGEILSCCTRNGRMYFFDLNTGSRFKDVVSIPATYGSYNYFTNTFWFYDDEIHSPTLTSFGIDGVKNAKELHHQVKLKFDDFYEKQTENVIKIQETNKRIPIQTPETMLKALISCEDRNKHHQINYSHTEDNNVSCALYMIMNILNKGCKNATEKMEEIDGLDPSLHNNRLECQTALFRSEFSTSISATFFKQLIQALEHFPDFIKGDMTNENLLDQYQFYVL